MMFAIFEDLYEHKTLKGDKDETLAISVPTFFKTLDETLGSGMGWSLSPTSKKVACKGRWMRCTRMRFTFEHVFDQDGTFCDVLFDDKLFIIRGDKKDHCEIGWGWR